MANLTIVGLQWGDEGKGKIVDWLMEYADVAVRSQGGHNAGHTVVVGDRIFKFNLLPSAVVREKLSFIGPGVVVDPWKLLEEIRQLEAAGIPVGPEKLVVSDGACLVLPWHRQIDAAREENAGHTSIGTTKSGIGPAYEDKVGRRAVRLADLADPDGLVAILDGLVAHHAPLRAACGLPEPDAVHLARELIAVAQHVLPFAGPVWQRLQSAHGAGHSILFEGAQGMMLDIDHGSYPYVTSSQTGSGQASAGSGMGPGDLGAVLGVVKAYTTRVGAGPFPTETGGATGRHLGQLGAEFGTVTQRKRRVGWFDAVAARQACMIAGVSALALTKLDVLDGLETVRICTGYTLDGEDVDCFPASRWGQLHLRPVYTDAEGWPGPTSGIRNWEDLPQPAQVYVEAIAKAVGVRVDLVSTSPERDDMIVRSHPLE